jgi:hypothetical protein
MNDLFGFRWRASEPGGSGTPGSSNGLDGVRARGEALLDASSRAIASVMDAQRFLTQNRQRSGQ